MNPTETVVRHITARTLPRIVGTRLIDGIHDMAVLLRHDGRKITEIRARTLRVPWTTCPEATTQLDVFLGSPIHDNRHSTAGLDQRQQCTHLLDLVRFAIGQIPFPGRIRYKVTVQSLGRDSHSDVEATVERDRVEILKWVLADGVVVAPQLFLGHRFDLRADLTQSWASDKDLFEAVMMLRRGLLVFRGRNRARPELAIAAEMTWMNSICFTHQPPNAIRARRPSEFDPIKSERFNG